MAPSRRPPASVKKTTSAKSPPRKRKAPRASRRSRPAAGRKTKAEAPARTDENFPIVGIGGSAGGFEAMGALLRALPAKTGMGFVLLQHLDPKSTSRYGQLLRRETAMPVEEIVDGIAVQPNHVYVLPPGVYAELVEGHLHLTKAVGVEHVRLPIDRFFSSLAGDRKHRAIGVVLSGSNADGTSGLRAIREEGGIAFAQSERSSKYFGMPGSAIEAGCVDFILSPEQIGARIGQISRHPWAHAAVPEIPKPDEAEARSPSKALLSIFSQLRLNSGVDFSLYKRSTIQRRITRRMALSRLEKMEEYARALRSSPGELDALFNDLLINVTHFFRDKSVFQTLQKRILPKLLRARRAEGGDLRIWVAGCATGEEVYSLAIIARETMSRLGLDLRIQVFGTDLSEAAIDAARAGTYPESIRGEISGERLRRFFNKVEGGYQVSRSIRDLCTFARQNICQDPPFSRIDLVSCRNVLIYLGAELQRRCIPVFHYALGPHGYLLLGSAETVGGHVDLFSLLDKRNKIYMKKVTTRRPALAFGRAPLPRSQAPKAPPPRHDQDLNAEILKESDRLLLHRIGPCGVIIDTQLQVIQFRGQTGIYLEHLSGEANLNILQMVRPQLALDLRTAIHKALKKNVAVRKEGIRFAHAGEALFVDLDVVPFKLPKASSERWLLILFHSREAPSSDGHSDGRRAGSHDGKSRLRDELRATKESLQAIIEEQEATNEELKSANEEIESSNEELQSSNEELETAKEELQSTNEELQTLNEELNTRNLELAQLNNDLSNLLSSINLPIVMVDNGLAVRRATPLAEKLFNLIPADIGRRLTDLKPNLRINDLEKLIHHVIETLQTHEREVVDQNNVAYRLSVRPYRTRDNKIDGAVLTVMDIDPIKRRALHLETVVNAVEAACEVAGATILVLDSTFRVQAATMSFRDLFDLKKADIEGRPIFELGDGWKLRGLHEYLRKAFQMPGRPRGRVLEKRFSVAGKPMLFRASALGRQGERLIVLHVHEGGEPRR